ncbi:MAG: radical SAM protein [Firmicutes bacterium]|nr:radical SAM protein [Bacillota bacterium]
MSYGQLFESGALHLRVERLNELLEPCRICPRECGALRISGERGECGAGKEIEISSFGPHHGEEGPLVGRGGSGTIFFAFCSLHCVFCQNFEISRGLVRNSVTASGLAEIMLGLQERGCENINLVTPTHYLPQIVEAVAVAAGRGLQLPLVYNCGGYERIESLRLLERIIDIYMPDFKYDDEKTARKYSGVSGYPRIARAALREMHRQVGDLSLDEDGAALKGLLIRHLVMPGDLAGTAGLMEFIARQISPRSWINIMEQYRPAYRTDRYPEIDRRITRREYLDALAAAGESGPGFNLL